MPSSYFHPAKINKLTILFFLFGFLLLSNSNSIWAGENSPKSISGPELMRLIDSDKAPMIIDVRSKREYKSGHIAGAIHIPFRSNFAKIEEIMADPERLIVVYCAYGPRAAVARRKMRKIGLKNVIPLTGHISKWKKNKLPLIK